MSSELRASKPEYVIGVDDIGYPVSIGLYGTEIMHHIREDYRPPTKLIAAIEKPRAPMELTDGAKLFSRMLADLGDIPCKYPCLRDDFYDWLYKQPDGSQWLAERSGDE